MDEYDKKMFLAKRLRKSRIEIKWSRPTGLICRGTVRIIYWNGKRDILFDPPEESNEFYVDVEKFEGGNYSISLHGITNKDCVAPMTKKEHDNLIIAVSAYADAVINKDNSYIWNNI